MLLGWKTCLGAGVLHREGVCVRSGTHCVFCEVVSRTGDCMHLPQQSFTF